MASYHYASGRGIVRDALALALGRLGVLIVALLPCSRAFQLKDIQAAQIDSHGEVAPQIVSHSQFGQDEWVISKHPQRGGYFIDIGAFDGIAFSNSFALEKQQGWSGICVEPMPHNFSERSCKLEQVAVSNQSGTANFKQCNDPQLSGLTDEYTIPRAECPEVSVKVISTRQLIEQSLPTDVRVIDYVSLDVEGGELTVLQDWPFERACVKLWTVEHNNITSSKDAIGSFLTSRGCSLRDSNVDWWAECPCS